MIMLWLLLFLLIAIIKIIISIAVLSFLLIIIIRLIKAVKKNKSDKNLIAPAFSKLADIKIKSLEEEIKLSENRISDENVEIIQNKKNQLASLINCFNNNKCPTDLYKDTFVALATEQIDNLSEKLNELAAANQIDSAENQTVIENCKEEMAKLNDLLVIAKTKYPIKKYKIILAVLILTSIIFNLLAILITHLYS